MDQDVGPSEDPERVAGVIESRAAPLMPLSTNRAKASSTVTAARMEE